MSFFTRFKIYSQRSIAQLYFIFESKMKTPEIKKKSYQLDYYIQSRKDFSSEPNAAGSIIIYAATIGELRAANVIITQLCIKWPSLSLILIAGQKQYADAYATNYPNAIVMREFPALPKLTDRFFRLMQPKLCVFIEGPSLHGYFPIRQDLGLSVACLFNKVPLIVVNACLYKKHIASKIDQIQHVLFKGLSKEAVQYWYVSNEKIINDLKSLGAEQEKVIMMGDIKFDANFNALPAASRELSEILNNYRQNGNCLIVAGSVNAFEEQKAVISGWLEILEKQPKAVLVLAPRYVNDTIMMNKLTTFLHNQGIEYVLRSKGVASIVGKKMLIIDTFGELPYFYQQADIAFAGRGHGVLEPTRYKKVVVVGPHNVWTKENSTSYFLYLHMRENKALIECDNYSLLGQVFSQILNDEHFKQEYIKRASKVIESQLGASGRIIEHICEQFKLN